MKKIYLMLAEPIEKLIKDKKNIVVKTAITWLIFWMGLLTVTLSIIVKIKL